MLGPIGAYVRARVDWGHREGSALATIPARPMEDDSALVRELNLAIATVVPVQVTEYLVF